MTPAQIIRQAEAQGIRLWVDGAELRVRGNTEAVRAILPTLKAHKTEILAALNAANDSGTDPAPPAPETSHAASGAESAPPTDDEPPIPADLTTVADWLARIGESPEGIAATLARCRADRDALAYFADLATKPAKPAQAEPEPIRPPMPTPAPSRAAVAVVGGHGIRCAECRHAEPTGYHVALVRCGAGRQALNPCQAFWKFDRRTCPSYAVTIGTSGTTSVPDVTGGTSNIGGNS